MTEKHRAILNFHGIGTCPRPFDDGEEDVWIDEARFTAFVTEIAANGACDVTFDDGNKSDIEIALPVLQAHGLRGTFFVLTGRIGEPNFLDQDDIRTLLAEGMRIGSHGRDHVSWRHADSNSLQVEIDDAKSELEHIAGHTITEAACPFGDYGRRTLRRLRTAGFQRVYSSDGGLTTRSQWFCPRRTIRANEDPRLIAELFAEPLWPRLLRVAKIQAKKIR